MVILASSYLEAFASCRVDSCDDDDDADADAEGDTTELANPDGSQLPRGAKGDGKRFHRQVS